ncbi:MAG: hypothetical protein U9O94_05725 [Nanoarchaeota archaeon]|nr:hypothetical protein [Nanoarchaeota archaeon]
MGSQLKLKNANGVTTTIANEDTNTSDITLDTGELARVNSDNLKNLSDGTLPTSDPLIAGQLWNNNGIVTVSAG